MTSTKGGLHGTTRPARRDDRCGIRTGLSVAVLHDGIAGSEPFACAVGKTAKHLLWHYGRSRPCSSSRTGQMLSVAFTDPATAADPVDEEPRRHSGPPVLRGERTRSLEPNRVTERLKAVACG